MVRARSTPIPCIVIRRASQWPQSRNCISARLEDEQSKHQVVFLFTTVNSALRFLADHQTVDWEYERLERPVLLDWLLHAREQQGADVALIDARATGTALPCRAFRTDDLIRILNDDPLVNLTTSEFSLWFA